MRPIDADAMDVEKIYCYYSDHCRSEDVQEWVNEQPTLDLEPVRRGMCEMCDISEAGVGKRVMFTNGWIAAIRKKRGKYALVINHEGEQIAIPIAFCPNCGARMDLEECE